MKINEVEALAGISKKNIRFYEEQGLLSPRRNSENGYRDYGENEVEVLRRIKVLRKLGVPIEEIRQMLSGAHTVSDGIRRHIITLERERRNLDQSIALCRELQNLDIPVSSLDAQALLAKMEQLEQGGASFQDKHAQDIRVRYVAPVVITVLMVALMTAFSAILLWVYISQPEQAPPVWILLLIVALFAAVGVGVVLALAQRIREIGKGEIDDAKHY